MLVDPGVSLQPLTPDADHLWPLQQAHLQLKRHGHLTKVPQGPTFQGVSARKDTKCKDSGEKVNEERGICVFLPFLREFDVFLWQDGEDLVQHLVRVGLTCQSHVVLSLEEEAEAHQKKLWRAFVCDVEWPRDLCMHVP